VESKETKQSLTLLVNKEVTPPAEIHEKVRPLLEESKRVVHDKLSKGLQSMRDISHHIDLISEASLLNLSHH